MFRSGVGIYGARTRSAQRRDRPQAALLRLACGAQAAQVVYVAAKLGLADLLEDGPRAASDLAAAADVDVSLLRRVLRSLVSLGVFRRGAVAGLSLDPAESGRTPSAVHTSRVAETALPRSRRAPAAAVRSRACAQGQELLEPPGRRDPADRAAGGAGDRAVPDRSEPCSTGGAVSCADPLPPSGETPSCTEGQRTPVPIAARSCPSAGRPSPGRGSTLGAWR